MGHNSRYSSMNSVEVIRRLVKEKREWEKMGTSPEVFWTIRGIKLSLCHVKAILKEQSYNERLKMPHVKKVWATHLYHAVERSLDYLKVSDRMKAIRILEKAKEQVGGDFI